MNVILVYNPKSGGALSRAEIEEKCVAHGINVEKFLTLEGSLAKKLSPFIKRKMVIVAIGGDGTLSTVAGLLDGTGARFAPIAGGTLNHFTKDLGLPQDIDDALRHLVKSSPRMIDVATVNDKIFINNSSVGLYPSSLSLRDDLEAKFGKWPAAMIASIKTLIHFRTFTVTINEETFQTPFVFVGNNKYAFSSPGKIERKSLNQGVLTIFIAKTVSRRTLVKIALFAFIGKAKHIEEFETRSVSSLTIHAHKRQLHVAHDGEISLFRSPLKFAIQKKALRIIG